jgi:hypothetical protein
VRIASGRFHWVALATVAVLASCGSPSGTTPTSADPTARPSSGLASPICEPIDLRTPSGNRIDLNGTWLTEREGTRAGVYFFRQVGSCVWASGGFPEDPATDESGPLSLVTVVLRGEVRSDFTITAEWADVRHQFRPTTGGDYGVIQLAIDVDDADIVRLVYTSGVGRPFIEPRVREAQSWVQISTRGAYPVPMP